MLVLHPIDNTTAFLHRLYQSCSDVTVLTQADSAEAVRKAVHHLPAGERLMLLGHGSDSGLFSRSVEGGEFDRIIFGHKHAYYLRGRRNVVGVWCNANLFAQKENLHGLFTGMIVSELSEAQEYNIATTQEELDRENILFAERLAGLLEDGMEHWKVPDAMKELDTAQTPLTRFNYNNLFYL